MSKRFFKGIVSAVLALSMILPMGGFTANAETNNSVDEILQETIQARAEQLYEESLKNQARKMEAGKLDQAAEPENVRVIVEFKTTPNRVSMHKTGTSTLSKIKSEQSAFMKKVASTGLEFEQLASFTEIFNGTSAIINAKDFEKILAMDGVVNVYLSQEYERPEPLMFDSAEVTEAPYAWANEFDGEGMIVGVIDSGFDVTHPDFVLTNPDKASLKPNSFKLDGLSGKYYTPKFPYGYNYYDDNHILVQHGYSHGQHVAGTVAANGVNIKGVAPEAQLLALRVFSNDPQMATTFEDIYIKAMEDGVTLGAHAFNLSLGAPAGFTSWTESAMDKAVNNSNEAGVVVAIANGNERNLVDGYTKKAADWMPDQGVAGSPALVENSLAVASSEKYLKLYEDKFVTYTVNGEAKKAVVLPAGGSPDPVEVLGEESYEFVPAGLGKAEDFEGLDLTGKVALVSRGEIAYTDKRDNATAAGAVAIIIYDNGYGPLTNMAEGASAQIPYVFTDKDSGDAMAALPEGERFVSFGQTPMEKPAIPMSSFSSWGATNDLRLKPEITAPGSDILSTQNGKTYGYSSGTSMATPHVAGGAAVVRDYIESTDGLKDLTELEKAKFSKLLMMNSAVALEYKGIARSPRVQGAGMMNLKNAVETSTLAYNPKTKEGKIELKEVAEKSFNLNLEVMNFGDEDLDYSTEVILLTDDIKDGHYTEFSRNVAHKITGANDFALQAGAKKSVDLAIDFTQDEIKSEQFIEGFVIFTDSKGSTTTVPFMGFYGDWNKPLTLDNFRSDIAQDPYGDSFFMQSALLTGEGNDLSYLDHSDLAFNPGNPYSPATDNIIPYLSFIRNVEDLKFSVLDENKDSVFTIGTGQYIRKINRIGQGAPVVGFRWDGELIVDEDQLEDGKYFYEIESMINYENAVPQKKQIPFVVDHKAPVIRNAEVYLENGAYLLGFEALDGPEDFNVGIDTIEIGSDLDPQGTIAELKENKVGWYTVDVTEQLKAGAETFYIIAYDYLNNIDGLAVDAFPLNEDTLPQIFLNEPMQVTESTSVKVAGYVFGWNYEWTENEIESLVITTAGIDPVTAELEFVENGLVYDVDGNQVYRGPHWIFDTTITMETGYTPLKLVAKAKDGSENSLRRFISVDEGAPQLDIKVRDREPGSDKATLDITMNDALPFLRLMEDGKEIFVYNGFNETDKGSEQKIVHEVALKPGMNKFTYTLYDDLGNDTVKVVEIERKSAMRISGDTRYQTAIKVSQEAFKKADHVIIVNGKKGVDGLLAGPLSVQLEAPILLVDNEQITHELRTEIERLGATKATILGGNLVISEKTEGIISELGLEVNRISGKTRFETSLMVDAEVRKLSGNTEDAVIANGYTEFDALAIGAHAGEIGVGILFNNGKDIKDIEASLEGVSNAILLGGTVVESEEVFTALKAKVETVNRISGKTRYATAVEIAKEFYADADTVIISNGIMTADALTGSALSAKYNAPMLVTPANVLDGSVKTYLTNNAPTNAYILGGTIAINANVKLAIDNLMK